MSVLTSRLTFGMAGLVATLALATPALAGPIFVDDFQDGQADGWATTGDGDVRLTAYRDNISLRFTHRAEALTTVSTRGFGDVVVAASLAGQSLGRGDACLAEVSGDGGATWQTVVRLDDGTDDGVTLVRGEIDRRLTLSCRVRVSRPRRTCQGSPLRTMLCPRRIAPRGD